MENALRVDRADHGEDLDPMRNIPAKDWLPMHEGKSAWKNMKGESRYEN